MSDKPKLVALSKGYAALRRDAGVTAELVRRAEAIADAAHASAGDDAEFEVVVRSVGGAGYNTGRVRVSVVCANEAARRAEAEHRALSLALAAGGG